MSIELAFAVIQVRHLVQQSILQGLHALNTLVQNSIQHIEVLNTSMIQHIMVNVPKMRMDNWIRQVTKWKQPHHRYPTPSYLSCKFGRIANLIQINKKYKSFRSSHSKVQCHLNRSLIFCFPPQPWYHTTHLTLSQGTPNHFANRLFTTEGQ